MSVLARYSAVLRGHRTAVPLLASVVGRLSLGMTGLALLLLVKETTGSYASAGLVSACYALAFGVFGPSRARSADRRGPVGVLLLTAALHPLALGLLVLVATSDLPTWVLVFPAVVGGATVPPLGPVMRAIWGALLEGPLRATAYSLESVVIELCFVLGPLLTALLAATVHPAAAVLVSAALALAGAVWMAATPVVREVVPVAVTSRSRTGPLAAPAVRALLLVAGGIGAGFRAIEVALPAYVEADGARPAAAGILLAVWSVGSIVGGLVYGGLSLVADPRRQLPVLVAALAVGTALPLLPRTALLMGVALFVYGLTIAPLNACLSLLLGDAAPAGTVTEAFAWSSSMIFGGAAIGSALAGVLVERTGPTAGLAVATVAGVLTLVAAVTGLARLRAPAPGQVAGF